MQDLLIELNIYYHEKSDPKYPGEHPRCSQLLDQITEEFKGMKESELKEWLDGMNDDQLEQITSALMDLDYDWVVGYFR